ncbi:MAG: hypothetical protein ACRC6A_01725 [Fusobacteriaceae bacterium]
MEEMLSKIFTDSVIKWIGIISGLITIISIVYSILKRKNKKSGNNNSKKATLWFSNNNNIKQ